MSGDYGELESRVDAVFQGRNLWQEYVRIFMNLLDSTEKDGGIDMASRTLPSYQMVNSWRIPGSVNR